MLARWTNFLATAALLLLLSSALMVGSAREGSENDGYTLEISVMDAGSGLPVKALMTVYSGNEVTAKLETTDNGIARALLPAGDYTFGVEARGYQPVKGRFSIVDAAVALTISMEKTPDDVSIGVLKAHIVDVVKNIPVIGVMTIYGPDGRSATFRSDERGFVKAELTFGEYKYGVEARGYQPVRDSFVLKEAILEIRVPMKLLSDEKPEPYGVIYGTVMGPEKRPVPGVIVMIMGVPLRRPVEPVPDDQAGNLPPVDASGQVYMERVQTDREGHFKVRVPFGGYQLMVEAKGFHPFHTFVELSREQKEVRVPIMLERMHEEPPFPDMRRVVVDLSYMDQDSDGNPEKFHLIMDLDGDKIPELEVSMIDRNSDGNPEELNVRSSLPLSMRERLLGLIMMLIKDPTMFPIPEYPGGNDDGWFGEDEDWEESPSRPDWNEVIRKIISDEDGADGSEQLDEEKEALEELLNDDEKNGSSVSDKEGGSDDGPNYIIAVGAMIALFLMILMVLSFGVLLRTGRKG